MLQSRYWRWLLPIIIFALALLPRIFHLGVFWGTDERYHWELSNKFFLALLNQDWANTVPQGLPGLTLAWIDAIAMTLKYAWAWLTSGNSASLEQITAPDRPFALLAERQIPVVVVNSLLVVGIFSLAARIIGRSAAWMGLIFVVLDPFLLAESRVLRFEALVTGFMALSFLAALVYLKEQLATPAQQGLRARKWLVLSAALAALAMLTKISAIFLLPAVALLGGATVLKVKSARTRPGAGQSASQSSDGDSLARHSRFTLHASSLLGWFAIYLLWAGLAAVCFWLFWPAMWVAPQSTLREVWTFAETASEEGLGGRGVFFWGQLYPDDPGPWFYPVALLFRLTPLVLLGVIIAIVGLAWLFRRWWPVRDEAGWQGWGTLLLLAYALLFGLMMSLGAKKYDRYLLPIFPALDLVAGVGWLWAIKWLIGPWLQLKQSGRSLTLSAVPGGGFALGGRRSAVTLFIGSWLILLALQSLTTLPHLPYYYTYYNPLLGGPAQAAHFIRVGFDEGLDQVAAYLEGKLNAAQIKLASGVSSNFEGLFSGQRIALDNLDGAWVQADYVLIYIAQLQRQKHAPDILAYLARHQPEYTLTLHGLDYAWLYPGPAAQYYGGGYKLEGRGTLFGYSFCSPSSSCRLRGGQAGADLTPQPLPAVVRCGEGENLPSPCQGGVAAGETLPVTLYWRNEGQLEDDRFFVRLMDLDGYVWAESMAQPRPGFEEANRQPNSIVESEAVITLPVGMPPGDYFFKPGFRTDSGEIIGYFELPGDTRPIQITTAQTYPPLQTFESPYAVQLTANDDLALVGYNLEPENPAPGAALWVTLYWQAVVNVSHDYVILLRLLDEQQQEAAYWLGRPVRSGYPTTAWRAGQIVQDPWLLTVPAKAAMGVYQLEIAVFDAESQVEVGRQALKQIRISSR